ncbi:50S ribosomal protein L22 [Thermoproteota archaeon]
MTQFAYSFTGYAQPYVKASGREIDVSPKHAREICAALKGKMIPRAKTYLEDVMDKKQPVPFKRYKLKVGHRSGLPGFHAGRYPTKAAEQIFGILENLENNGDFKGMDTERMKIIHASAIKGRKIKKFKPRAFGRTSAHNDTLVHIELAATEV